MTGTKWLICIIASIGFAFDIYELLMLPLIAKPALAELSQPRIDAEVKSIVDDGLPEGKTEADLRAEVAGKWKPSQEYYVGWVRTLFFVPAIFGGLFGLLGGYLTDRLGRRRVLTWSILLYAFSACAAGYATSLEMLLFFRCLVFVGVCVEFVAAVAWLAELFPEPTQRQKVLGYTQAFSSVGGLLVSYVAHVIAGNAEHLWEIYEGHSAWRYTLISGLIPAIPLIVIRPFLPESPVWQRKKMEGTLKRPNIAELFNPALARTTILTTLLFATSYAFAFGSLQQLPQIMREHAGIEKLAAETVKEKQAEAAANPEIKLPPPPVLNANALDEEVAEVQLWQEVGGLVGRFILAVLAIRILSRRRLLGLFLIPAAIFIPSFFYWISSQVQNVDSVDMIKYGIFIAGMLTTAQFSFWGNYIPLVFPVHLRGTGEGFAANIGGRVLGTAAAWFALTLSTVEGFDPPKACALVVAAYAAVGVLLLYVLPEPESLSEAE
jgi:MFS family permease